MAICKECGSEYQVGVKDCCSEECFKKNIEKRAKIATRQDSSHTSKF